MMNKICKVDGCLRKQHYSIGYCTRHYNQVRVHGKILKRTRFTKNNYKVHVAGYLVVDLYDRNGNKIDEFLCDEQDKKLIKKYKWHIKKVKKNKYVSTTVYKDGKKINKCFHQFLNDSYEMTDHINRNTLDNRRHNLRDATYSVNNFNQNIQINNTSGVTGVQRCHNKWRAIIFKNSKRIHLGYFDKFKDAVKIRKNAELKYFGEIK